MKNLKHMSVGEISYAWNFHKKARKRRYFDFNHPFFITIKMRERIIDELLWRLENV